MVTDSSVHAISVSIGEVAIALTRLRIPDALDNVADAVNTGLVDAIDRHTAAVADVAAAISDVAKAITNRPWS